MNKMKNKIKKQVVEQKKVERGKLEGKVQKVEMIKKKGKLEEKKN
jgi:hypothetical protein